MATTVFITGATGYIGHQLAVNFAEAGFRVFGLVRSQEKGAHLARHEVTPVVGDINDPASYHEALAHASVVIDTVMDFARIKGDLFEANRILLTATAKAAAEQEVTKTYIYTSGVLVYDHSERVRDESYTLKSETLLPIFKARVAFENEVLNHSGVRGIVLRPGFVFGGAAGAGNHLHGFFQKASTSDKIVIQNNLKDKRWNWIHVADLADGFIRAVKRASHLKGEAINLVSDSHPTYDEISHVTARVAGFKGTFEYTDEPGTDFVSQAATKTVLLTHHKARELLGWSPSHVGAIEDIDLYYRAWRADQK